MSGRRVAGVVGVVTATLGLAMLAYPGAVGALTVGEILTLLLGVGSVLQGVRLVWDRVRSERSLPALPTPETPPDRPVPGDDVDDLLGQLRPFSRRGVDRSDAHLRTRLERAAVRTLQRRWGFAADRARDLVREGRWTTDPVAAAFFQPGVATPSPGRSPVRGFLAFVRSESVLPDQVHRVITAIETIADEEEGD